MPLRAPITDKTKVHYVGSEGEPPCTGTVTKPTAPEGETLVYEDEVEHATFSTFKELEGATPTASVAGAYLVFKKVEEYASGRGSWAVTGG